VTSGLVLLAPNARDSAVWMVPPDTPPEESRVTRRSFSQARLCLDFISSTASNTPRSDGMES
jgi:hypothetical protein